MKRGVARKKRRRRKNSTCEDRESICVPENKEIELEHKVKVEMQVKNAKLGYEGNLAFPIDLPIDLQVDPADLAG